MSTFWPRYISALQKRGVKQKNLRWYVMRAEAFVRSQRNGPSSGCTPEAVQAYFADLGRSPSLKPWQFKQAITAVRILCVDVVRSDWAKGFDWEYWDDAAEPLEPLHPTIAREVPLERTAQGDPDRQTHTPYAMAETKAVAAVCKRYPNIMKGLLVRIRTRQQSIRTEKAYQGWVARFVVFHDMKDPREMGGPELVQFLEFLAVKRHVAASTQNQAS